ncbi:DUF6508 domain-containing protein [Rhodococcoides yunnanense]|uniref:DUF6508 domain-containing protein n=1 Tax=Rhodococcoides yunnanense TaxID=278209 RepID=UPI001114F164|nr:DUF6508 domain-containing protein [Rhodococcus yunnanensis]
MTEDNPLAELSEEDRSALRSLADRLDANPDAIGSWVLPEPLADGSTHVGYVDYGSLVQEFLEFMYAKNLVIQFDWPRWRGKEVVQEGNVREINTATPDDALKYLTVMIRADRFSEGALLDAFENGLVSCALHRVLGHPAASQR